MTEKIGKLELLLKISLKRRAPKNLWVWVFFKNSDHDPSILDGSKPAPDSTISKF